MSISYIKVNDPSVIEFFKLLKNNTVFGIKNKDGLFIGVPSIDIDPSGNLYYLDSKKRRTSVRSLIMSFKGLQSARWLDHLYFIDRNTNIVSFKKYLSSTYNLNFT
jgi:hypothetical protein